MAVPCKPYEAVRLGKGLRSIAHQRRLRNGIGASRAHGKPTMASCDPRQQVVKF